MNEMLGKKKTYMDCWKYFKRNSDKNIAICNYCKKELSCKGSQTTGLHRHLEAIHNMTRTRDKTEVDDASTSAKRIKVSTTLEKYLKCGEVETMEEIVSKLAVVDNMTILSIAKSEFVRKSLQLQGFKQLPKHSTDVMNLIKKFSSHVKLKIIDKIHEMKNEKKKISLSVDEWTSFRNRRYLNVQIYLENGSSINLGLIRIHGSCPAEKIVELVTKKLKDFSLDFESDVVGMTSDGASVMVKFGRLSHGYLQLCYNHGIHLAIINVFYVKKAITRNDDDDDDISTNSESSNYNNEDEVEDDFKIYSTDELHSQYNFNILNDNLCETITNIRNIVKLFKNSPMRNTILQNYVKKKENKELSLLLDCPTRWNSMLTMVQRFLRLADSIEKALSDLNRSDLWSTDLKIKGTEIFETLKPVQIAVEALSRQDTNLLTAEAILLFLFQSLTENKTNLSTKLLVEIKHQITKRRDIPLISVIKFLNDPKIKNVTNDEHDNASFFKLCSKSQIVKTTKCFLQRLKAFDDDDEDVFADETDDIIEIHEEEKSMSLEEKLEASIRKTLENKSVITKDNGSISKEISLFEITGQITPLLQRLKNALSTIRPTSTQNERNFSTASHIVNKKRTRLSDKSIDALAFIKFYFQKNN